MKKKNQKLNILPASDMGDKQLLPHPVYPQLGIIFLPKVFGELHPSFGVGVRE